MKKVLVTGALGQIGSELVVKLKNVYGEDNVIASGRRKKGPYDGLFELVDVTQPEQIFEVVKKHKVDWVIHLAALLSAVGENNPTAAWNINMGGLFNILEVAKQEGCGVFVPSSIAAFGPNTPKINTPQDTIQRPTTMYGVTKVAGEILCDYYYKRFGVDTRGVRFPGLISYETLPGGGTTDYAVHIYYEALKQKKFTCPLDKETHMDMMYMPDALNAIVNLMEADDSKLIHRNAFNIASMSFCPEDICKSIQKFIPEFTMDYDINPTLQNIANSWPDSLDDSNARNEWGWKPEYDLDSMTKDMLEKLREKLDIK
ncbi:L-threonine 3-dehydrogenase [Abyssisolibacter fermentans]|uniref:L-threonine 3-dehydrogenase n=1 Tax=Abyssisolibacter fermentans TaxID=1766203 RepID=UPI00082FCFFE|nr:L-threonine 3-dehydrogenase [Abyssisolibacter fermentans]